MRLRVASGTSALSLALLLAACGNPQQGKSANPHDTPPVASAGADRSVAPGASVTLSGSGSDADGDALAFSWQQTLGPPVTLSDARIAHPQFTAPDVDDALLEFELTVRARGAVATDTVRVTVHRNRIPVASAGDDLDADENADVALSGTGLDADGDELGYQWTQLDGEPVTLSDAASPKASFTAPSSYAARRLTFRLQVTDPSGATAQDDVRITVHPVSLPLAQYVDPRIGSEPPGFTNPGAVVPFGMVTLGPDTEGPISYGGYYFHNTLINGFSHVHVSAGVFKAGEIPVMPFTGAFDPPPSPLPEDFNQYGWPGNVVWYASAFDKATEVAQAGYYAATLSRYAVQAELTATERVGMHRYTFLDPAQAPRVLVHVARELGEYGQGASAHLGADGVLLGHVDSHDGYPVFFALVADSPFTAATFGGAPVGAEDVTGRDLGVLLDFPETPGTVQLKVAISYTDEAGARANLAEIAGWDFDAVRAQATAKWNHALSRLRVEGGNDLLKTSFYSALYRVYQSPSLIGDVDGRYRGPDGVHQADGFPHYTMFSSWDSYRAQNALQVELYPDAYRDMVRSLLAFHRQAGYLPRWQQGPKDASHMTGDPIIPFIGEAWCRGYLDAELRGELWPALQNLVTRRSAELMEKGYLSDAPADALQETELQVPVPNEVPGADEFGLSSSGTSATLEYGVADFSLALMAKSAVGAAAADAIAQRSLNYRRLINTLDDDGTGTTLGFVRPRMADGSFLTPFRPESGWGFQEGTSWQYSWMVMHDYAGVIAGMGGDEVTERRLDEFFGFPAGDLPLLWPTLQNQITLFGIQYFGDQYAPGNEHDLEAPYVYLYTSAPWKTAVVSRAAASIYTPTPNGLPGNDDLGALSGWLVWNMAGLYPINPGTPLYVVGSPQFTKVTFKRDHGDFVIDAPAASEAARFVTRATLDGVEQPGAWLVAPRGTSTVTLDASPVPDMDWAVGSRPPSYTTDPSLEAFRCTP